MVIKKFPSRVLAYLPLILCLGAAPRVEIQVSLFGRTCLMSGPYETETLKAIHSISPGQIPPILDSKQAKVGLKTLAGKTIPTELQVYTEALKKYLEAMASFYDGVEALKIQKTNKEFLERIRTHLRPRDYKRIEEAAATLKLPLKDTAAISTIETLFTSSAPANPEAEFHRTTRRMGIKYNCDFEENEN
jgi:hypothetical protein